MNLALDKTIQEFKMWKAMTRKPGQPADYMRLIYANALADLRLQPTGGEKHPEISLDKAWEAIVKKLMQNEYTFNTGFYGSLNDYTRKIAYFFQRSLQGAACYPGAAEALRYVHEHVGTQGLLGDGQSFTALQLGRALREQGAGAAEVAEWLPERLHVLSYAVRARRPSERLFKEMLARLKDRDIDPGEVLHVGASATLDVAPARRLGMRTALFAGDKASLQVTAEQLKQSQTRPDVLITDLPQIAEVVGGR
jgi:putative hydrolase of the HAD superfamily